MIHNIHQLETKDWARMRDLIVNNKNGAKVAKSIKDKRKAIARFVAGNILCCANITTIRNFYHKHSNFTNAFSVGVFFEHFGNRALELGASIDDIATAYKKASIPSTFSTDGCPISNPSIKENLLQKSLGLVDVIKEIDPDAFSKGVFAV